MKKQVEFFDRDFLDNKIEVGDKVIFEAPKYRDFVIGTVISKAPKSCQVEYMNDWNYGKPGVKLVVRQGYGQLIKYPIKEGKWIGDDPAEWECSLCQYKVARWNNTPYCPCCDRYFRWPITTARRNTAYHEESANYLTACKECHYEDYDYYNELWKEYNAGRL